MHQYSIRLHNLSNWLMDHLIKWIKSSVNSGVNSTVIMLIISPVNVVIYPKQIATVMKPSFWLTIYMYKQHTKNQPKSNIWNTVKFEEQIIKK